MQNSAAKVHGPGRLQNIIGTAVFDVNAQHGASQFRVAIEVDQPAVCLVGFDGGDGFDGNGDGHGWILPVGATAL
jgi:hypothetical protein